MADEPDRPNAVPMWTDAVRRLRDLATQLTGAAQAAAVAGARATPRVLSQPMAAYAGQLLAVSSTITTPLRRLLDEQERLVEQMAEWAEQHQQLAEQIAGWADQQRVLSEQMVELARPFLDQSAMLESLQAELSGRPGDGEPPDGPYEPDAATTAPARKRKKAPAATAKRSSTKIAAPRKR